MSERGGAATSGRCGRCSSGPGAGCRTRTSAACTPPTRRLALRNARDLYTRRQEGVSIWVVPAAAITASSPDEKDAFFDPAADKVYRHPTFYEVPGGGRRTCDRATAFDVRAAARPTTR